ncbi:MAG: thioesterase [Lachnospiraceae bacterium]|nr:thioesterase [Lachnospiraceae bacterium]
MSKPQLYLVPFAGGSSYSFKHILPMLEKDFEVHAWDGPGKGVNSDQPKNKRFDDEVRAFADYVKAHNKGREYYAWGYSCGGLICYEAMRLIQSEGHPLPKRVFLSAVRPAAEFVTPDTGPLNDEKLLDILVEMSGAGNKDALLERIDNTREDMELASDYRYRDTGKVNAPASVMYADDDVVTASGVTNWENYFTGPVNYGEFHGKHFFYKYQPEKLVDFIIREAKE